MIDWMNNADTTAPTDSPTHAGRWALQRTRTRRDERYVQLVYADPTTKKKTTVSLGWMTDATYRRAQEGLAAWGTRILGTPDARSCLTTAEVRASLLEDPGLVGKAMADALARAEVTRTAPSYDAATLTLATFVDEIWLPVYREEQTMENYDRDVRSLWKFMGPVLGPVRLANIDGKVWRRYLATKTDWRAASTRARARAFLMRALHHAVDVGYLDDVPDLHVRMRRGKRTHAEGALRASVQRKTFTEDEALRVLNAGLDARGRAMFAMALCAGLRPTEVSRLRWENVMAGEGPNRVDGTKNAEAAAEIHIPVLARHHLDVWWAEQGHPTTGWVFPGHGGDPQKDWSKRFNNARKRAGIEAGTRKLTRYSMRHTCATLLFKNNGDPEAIRRVLRHSANSRTLERWYLDVTPVEAGRMLQGVNPFDQVTVIDDVPPPPKRAGRTKRRPSERTG
jgi:integrase